MKVVVSIPAYNEEETVGAVVRSVPKDIADEVLVVVVDDGSVDDTSEEARKAGAKVIKFKGNRGLACAFRRGVEEGINLNADVIVNIDADGQYVGGEIRKLIEPIRKGEADVVLGSRFAGSIEHMPLSKRVGNIVATRITGFLSGIKVTDAQTGFRAFSREAALRLNVLSDYTYTQETIIQAAHSGLTVKEVPVTFRKRKGESRLISNIFSYALRSGSTILKTYLNHRPMRTFTFIGGAVFAAGLAVGSRVLVHYLRTGFVTPYIPSAILTAVLLIIGFQVIILGLIADMVGANRKLLDELLYRSRKKAE
jgi:glycosyltransferase involved in cell wall biosynthesis